MSNRKGQSLIATGQIEGDISLDIPKKHNHEVLETASQTSPTINSKCHLESATPKPLYQNHRHCSTFLCLILTS